MTYRTKKLTNPAKIYPIFHFGTFQIYFSFFLIIFVQIFHFFAIFYYDFLLFILYNKYVSNFFQFPSSTIFS